MRLVFLSLNNFIILSLECVESIMATSPTPLSGCVMIMFLFLDKSHNAVMCKARSSKLILVVAVSSNCINSLLESESLYL